MSTFSVQKIEPQANCWKQTLLIEDNISRVIRLSNLSPSTINENEEAFAVTLHSVIGKDLESSIRRCIERPEKGDLKNDRVGAALSLLSEMRTDKHSVVSAGPNYGSNSIFLQGIRHLGLSFAVEIPASQIAHIVEKDDLFGNSDSRIVSKLAAERTKVGGWSYLMVSHPVSEQRVSYAAAHIGYVRVQGGVQGWLSVLQTGAILNNPRGAVYVFSSEPSVSLEELICVVGWARWIRPYTRKLTRPASKGVAENSRQWSLRAINPAIVTDHSSQSSVRSLLTSSRDLPSLPVRIVELFAGAGGMGLGFFLAKNRPPVHLLYSGEVHPVYAETLRTNHGVLAARPENKGMLPTETKAVDLRSDVAKEEAAEAAGRANGVDIMIGGPPCQGFSSANRNSWHGSNPNNLLIDTYLSYVADLQPRIFVMENVQGIVSSPKAGQEDTSLSVLDYFAQQMTQAGYRVFPKLVDASLYGVPQRRNRCFIVGLHQDLGWSKGDFDTWGPFPKPTHGPGTERPLVTVGDAIRDLPRIENGETVERQYYTEPGMAALQNNEFLQLMRRGAEAGIVTDHITSRHAEYVIERYRRIPQGGNWRDIQDQLTNYANAGRTHSNIYRRLDPDQPSVTIGHYRKSMIVHPDQDRGLSLREAARLQSFPDWFRFAGVVKGEKGEDALGHKQQQLANAVCPLVTKALAENLFNLLRKGQ